jgi:DNA-binding CsgD family transcriptional regulator
MTIIKYPVATMFDAASPFPTPKRIETPPDAKIKAIIETLYDAALGESAKWAQALGGLRQEFNATGVVIACPIFEKGYYVINILTTEEYGTIDIAHYEKATLNDKGLGLFASFGGCALSSDIHRAKDSSQRRIDKGEVPPQFARHLSLTRVEPPYWDTIMILRSIDDAPFTQDDCDRLGAAYNDFRQIATIIHARAQMVSAPENAISILSQLDGPFALADGNGEIIFINEKAQIILDESNINPFIGSKWEECAQNAIRNGSAVFFAENAQIKLNPIKLEGDSSNCHIFNYGLTNILLSFEIPPNLVMDIGDKLKKQYKLSQIEVEILLLVFEGYGPTQIANIRKKSLETIRTQLRSLRKKTDTKNLVDLMQLQHEIR